MDSNLRTAVASGMGAVIGGEPMEPAHALAALAATPHLICHSAFFIERLGVAAQAPRASVRAAREQRHFDGDRAAVRAATVRHALERLVALVRATPEDEETQT